MWPFGSVGLLCETLSLLSFGGGDRARVSRCCWGRNQWGLCVPEWEFVSQAPVRGGRARGRVMKPQGEGREGRDRGARKQGEGGGG